MLVETTVFHLAEGADEAAFLAADAEAQQSVAYRSPALLRRTTAKSDDGSWLVVTLWDAEEPAADLLAPLSAFLDPASVEHRTFKTLD